MRGLALVVATVVLTAAVASGRERVPAHPNDETEVFTGAEETESGTVSRPPALRFWRVRATLAVPASTRPTRVALFVPLSDGRQDVLSRRITAPGLTLGETPEAPNLRVEWTGESTGGTTIQYEVVARIGESTATLPETAVSAVVPPPDAGASLAATPRIQSAAPDVVRRARGIVGKATRLDEVVWALYQYTAAFLPSVDPPGPQDASSVLAARRGTSLGRARALVALLRAAAVRAQLVGGLRLTNSAGKRATNSWVEAWTGTGWVPLDPAGGHFGTLPASYLALYRGDLPLIVHTAGLEVDYAFSIRETTRRAAEEGEGDEVRVEGGHEAIVRGAGSHPVETHAAYVKAPIASVVLITDRSVSTAATDRILAEAREASIDCVVLTAQFESRYFRETYLERLVAANLAIIRQASLVLVATADDAGLYALLALGERNIRMPDSRIVVAGAMPIPTARMLGSLLYHLIAPGEVVLVRRQADLVPLWEMARANLTDGVPMRQAATTWGIDPVVLGEAGGRLPAWRRPLMHAWARVVRAQVPLPALTLILILPIIATIVVIARLVVGFETFGMFGPVIVSLAFITTGLEWGTLIFVVIVGLGVGLRTVLQRLRLQAVARLAILIALVAAVMGGLTLLGATLGIGPLLNISIFPMVIMSNVIESFAASQVEFGTGRALRMTVSTLLLSIVCYLVVEYAGLQSLILAFPEILIGVIVLDVLLGKWRGLRLSEYLRFLRASE